MITYKQGNLLQADSQALVNAVNCVGIMGKGIALQFKQAFPDNFKQYAKACRSGQIKLGTMFVVSNDKMFDNPHYIINFPTKQHWRDKSKLSGIETGLQDLIAVVQKLNITSIALPPLGCGNGGLEWSEVEPIIKKTFEAIPQVEVLLYAPQEAIKSNTMPVNTKNPDLTRARALLIRLLANYQVADYTLSMLEVQKLAYFLQEAGETLKLCYSKEQFGPYAHNLNFVLQVLEGHYIRGYGDLKVRAEIRLEPGAIEKADTLLAGLPDALDRLKRVSQLIEGFETPYGMELLATVHWVIRENSQTMEDVDVVDKVHQWSERKNNLFNEKHINKAWQRLQEQNWILTPNQTTNLVTF